MTQKVTVFVFDSHRRVQDAIRAMKNAGCDLRKLSIVGKDCCSVDHSLNYCADSASQKTLAERIAFWHKMWTTLSGDAFLTISEIGPVLVAGPLTQPLIAAWTDLQFHEGLSPLQASLRSFHLPIKKIAEYEAALCDGEYLVLLHGDSADGAKARQILQASASGSQSVAGKSAVFIDGLTVDAQRA